MLRKNRLKHGFPVAFILILLGSFLLGPLVSTGPYTTDISGKYLPPSSTHLLGTDHLGRDILSRVLTAGLLDVGIALVSALVALSVGSLLGAISGYLGGIWDHVLMRVFDIWQSIPGILFGLLVITVFGKGLIPLMAVISLSFVPMYARMVRSELLPERNSVVVEAARLSHVPEWKILLLYLLPAHMTAPVAYVPIQAAFAIGMTAGLGFIGLGVKPPAPEWGAMISEGMGDLIFLGIWWTTLPAGVLLGLTSFLLFHGGDVLAKRMGIAHLDQGATHRPIKGDSRVQSETKWLPRDDRGAKPFQNAHTNSRGIYIRGLSVTYTSAERPVHALRGIDVELMPGEITAVIGESGSGKTTLAKTLIGALPASARVTLDMSDLPRRIAFVQQEATASLHPLITVGEQITDIIVARKKSQREHVSRRDARQETYDLFEQLGLTPSDEYYRSFPHRLSGGQAQRVSLARALGIGAQLLIADEPTSQLDLITQAEAVRLIHRLTKEHHMYTMFVTHRLELVAEMADTVIVLHDGQVVERGRVTDVWNNPKHDYTKKLLGDMHRSNDAEKQRDIRV